MYQESLLPLEIIFCTKVIASLPKIEKLRKEPKKMHYLLIFGQQMVTFLKGLQLKHLLEKVGEKFFSQINPIWRRKYV